MCMTVVRSRVMILACTVVMFSVWEILSLELCVSRLWFMNV